MGATDGDWWHIIDPNLPLVSIHGAHMMLGFDARKLNDLSLSSLAPVYRNLSLDHLIS